MKRKKLQNKNSKKLESKNSFQIKNLENKMFTVQEITKMEEVQIMKLQKEFADGVITENERIRKEIYVRGVARLRISQVSGRK